MPTYEYNCKNCGRFDLFQKISAAPLTECPTCMGEVKRVINASAVVFKASGFYTTDTRSNSHSKEDSASGSDSDDKAS